MSDPRLCAAIVERLIYNGAIIQLGTESYRLAHTTCEAGNSKVSGSAGVG